MPPPSAVWRVHCIIKVSCRTLEIAGRLAHATIGMVPYEESSGTHCAFVAKVVEYLAVGLPVVCTPLDGIRRYFADEPLIRFSRFDGVSFGDALLSWLREPLPTRSAPAGPAACRVRERLDWKLVCGRAADVIEGTLRRTAA
jgi:glycosyltransferase involved in cell wall biosynthesis